MKDDCFRDIHNIGTGYKKAKGYCRTEHNTPEVIPEVKIMRNHDCATNVEDLTSRATAQT